MSSEYTPPTEEVREAYQMTGDGLDFRVFAARRGEEFDCWLASVRAEAWDEGHRAPIYISNFDGDYLGKTPNPHRKEQ